MIRMLTATAMVLLTTMALAHEGHNDAPGAIKTHNGGLPLGGKQLNLEYVISGSEVKIFPLAHEEGKTIDLSKFKITGQGLVKPGKNKPYDLKFEAKDGSFVAPVDFQSGSRVEVKLTTDYNGKKDSYKPIQVEKQ